MTAMTVFTAPAASGQALPDLPRDRAYLQNDGNELIVWRNAPVAYRTLEALNAAVERPFPASSRVVRLVRATPPQVIDYVVCITGDGTLILGEQVFAVDAAGAVLFGEAGRAGAGAFAEDEQVRQ